MKICLIIILICLATTLLFQLHTLPGAILFGVAGVALDLFWQMLRLSFLAKSGTGKLLLGIVGGILIRIISIYLLMVLGKAWLLPSAFNIFIIVLLTIPLVSLIILRSSREGGQAN